jgi:hypothetical protein
MSRSAARPPGGHALRLVNSRLSTAIVGGMVGAVTTAATAVLAGLGGPLGYAVLGAAVGGLSAFVLGPSVATGRPLAGLALTILIQSLGVLSFPIAGPLLGLEAPWMGDTGGPLTAGVVIFYPFTPIGFLVALPFVPAAIATGLLSSELGRQISIQTPAGSGPVDPDEVGDARFRRRVVIASVVLVVMPIVGFVWLNVILKTTSWGY